MLKIFLILTLVLGSVDAEQWWRWWRPKATPVIGCTGSGTAYTCSPGTTIAQVETVIAAASDGVTITFLAGAYTWTTGSIDIPNAKGVTFACATESACTMTVGASKTFFMDGTLDGNNVKNYRITGFVFEGGSGSIVHLWATNPTASTMNSCRFDHNTFNNFTGNYVFLFGSSNEKARFKCVIDHNTYTTAGNHPFVFTYGTIDPDAEAGSGIGTADNLFLEDNTLNTTAPDNLSNGCIDGHAGARVVVRNNDSTGCLWTAHGTTHNSGMWNFEFYRNALRRVVTGAAWEGGNRLFHHQGSGEMMLWGNTYYVIGAIHATALSVSHYRSFTALEAVNNGALDPNWQCDGDDVTFGDGNTGANGYPCWMQPGRAPSGGTPAYGDLSPIYVWGNTNNAGGAKVDLLIEDVFPASSPNYITSHIVANRDFYNAVSVSAQSSATTPFDGTTGMGFGTIANRPTTCTTSAEAGGGVGYWATDEGEWDSSNGATADGKLYKCTATNTWTAQYGLNATGLPYTYPHPKVTTWP